MKEKNITSYIISAVVGLIFFGIYAYSNGLFTQEFPADTLRVLCDCFTVPGVVLAGAGAISWASSKGTYDMLGYGGSMVATPIINVFRGKKTEYKGYYDYKQEKAEKRKPWLKETFFVGLGFLVLAGITLAVYYII